MMVLSVGLDAGPVRRGTGDTAVGSLAAGLASRGEGLVHVHRGAGLADPIALLAEGRILEAIVDSLKQVVPGSRSAAIGDHKLKAVTQEIKGIDSELVLTGVMKLED